jgi:hypothetical protein
MDKMNNMKSLRKVFEKYGKYETMKARAFGNIAYENLKI